MTDYHKLLDLNEYLYQFPHECLECIDDVHVGDIVACFGDEDSDDPTDVGVVKFVGYTPLPKGHPDGEAGELYVLTYAKRRYNNRKKMSGELHLDFALYS